MADDNTPSAIPGEPLKAGTQTSTPHDTDLPDTPPAGDTLVADAPAKSGGAGADRPGGSGTSEAIRREAAKLQAQATEKARGYVDQGKARATGSLDDFARMMEEAADTVDEKLGEQYGQYARSAASRLSGLSESIRGKEIEDMLADARELVRKSPAVAIGTAAAIGFALARVLKSGFDAASETGDRDSDKSA